MPIIITNTGSPYRREEEDSGGLRNYEVRINCKLITSFQHSRRDGLAVCLRKASEAVAKLNEEVKI